MKNSGIEWVGEIPADWNIKRIAAFYTVAHDGVRLTAYRQGFYSRRFFDERYVRPHIRLITAHRGAIYVVVRANVRHSLAYKITQLFQFVIIKRSIKGYKRYLRIIVDAVYSGGGKLSFYCVVGKDVCPRAAVARV